MKDKIEPEDLKIILDILHQYDQLTALATLGVIAGLVISSDEDPLTRRTLLLGHIKGLLS